MVSIKFVRLVVDVLTECYEYYIVCVYLVDLYPDRRRLNNRRAV